ncbi:FAD-binding oxidoreductase [Achromobacter seleniivolatilans]|uniref:FAD-binding oxidoreductase n=1 Tax=Achromobacter seleniivolatilans TaxID=3047478 RepID=A0ABY9M1I3_9BURK|nr:FAD-binding oxidoreductase [Achromobacter sp. R39]WMD20858.1 FAD-binding oxidoreductase [Achromobacter sp. R39]
MNPGQDVIIIGAGIVGLNCALAAQQTGFSVTVIDPAFEGDRASHGNAGSIAVAEHTPFSVPGVQWKAIKWLMDPLGPLALRWQHLPRALPWFMAFNAVSKPGAYRRISEALARLNNRALEDFIPMLDTIGLRDQIHCHGAITVYEQESNFRADTANWALKRELGVNWTALSADEIRSLEPRLAPVFSCGVRLHDCAHVSDPKAIVDALRRHVAANGATLVAGQVRGLNIRNRNRPAALLEDGRSIDAAHIVVAAGAWSAPLARTAGDRVLLESERGYNTTLPAAGAMLQREVIFAERKFVATPLSVGLRIGGAAEFAGLNAPPNYARSQALLTMGRRLLPGMDETGAVQWAGHRPATPDSLPVIGRSPNNESVLYAFGHGHLGLTQSATTGLLIADLLAKQAPRVDLAPYSIQRFSR